MSDFIRRRSAPLPGTVRIHQRGRRRIVIERGRGGRGCSAKIDQKNGCCIYRRWAAAMESRRDQQEAADAKACHSIFRSCRSVFGSYSFRSSISWFSRAVMNERNILDPLSRLPWRQITRGRESGFSLPFQRSSSRAGAS